MLSKHAWNALFKPASHRLLLQPAKHFAQLYRPSIHINFGKEERFHLYHSEGGERFLTNCTRLNMLFIAGNSMLLLLEVVSPCKKKMT